MNATRTVLAATLMTTAALSGCRVSTSKDGDNENVKVATPFGGVQVKTNDAAVASGFGLPTYPGAELVKKDKDNGSADINLSFGNFQLRVKAASYRTPDDPDKVKAFYLNAMKRYGTVIECNRDQPVGTPTQTEQGLTCSDSNNKRARVTGGTDSKVELKTGSKQHQRIVAIDPEGNGTKFGLVLLDLSGNLSVDDDRRQ